MKKIIAGRKYDTDTATQMATHSNDYSNGALYHYEEELYRKRNGEFFLHGEGGPGTRYGHAVGANNRAGGEGIIPLTFQEALLWAYTNLEIEEVEKIFGEIPEDNGTRLIGIHLPGSLIDKLSGQAAARQLTLSQLIAERLS